MQSERLKCSIKGLEVGVGGVEKQKRKAFRVVMSSNSASLGCKRRHELLKRFLRLHVCLVAS